MAKDMTGAKLEVGDFVHIDMPGHVFGYVKKIEEGGIITGSALMPGGKKADEIKPGVVFVEVVAQNAFDPRNEICNAIVKCHDPEKKAKLKVV